MSPHGNKFRTNVQFSPDLAQRIEQACASRDLSVAALIRQAMIDYLDRLDATKAGAGQQPG